ncbi:hypothetical protein [uncultured Vagococcus sp.]|uniref:hypothetical protein n=1 Tax=uncultured Vagococcus sp. TaxID=189676 RepID=UPI00258CE606|nr:hypothetical protein [uncultured Vagococcus sp.]
MRYLDKLKKVQGNLENLDNKSKEEVIKFAQLIVKMSISREEGHQYADDLIQDIHDREIENQVEVNLAILKNGTDNFELLNQFEMVTGFKLDNNLLQDLAKGTVVVKSIKGD